MTGLVTDRQRRGDQGFCVCPGLSSYVLNVCVYMGIGVHDDAVHTQRNQRETFVRACVG